MKVHSAALLPMTEAAEADMPAAELTREVLKRIDRLDPVLHAYVTVDAAALCVKSGNALILRGGKEAAHSNAALGAILRDCLPQVDLPRDAVQLVETPDRSAVGHLLRLNQYIDLTIPRGGESLIRRVAADLPAAAVLSAAPCRVAR